MEYLCAGDCSCPWLSALRMYLQAAQLSCVVDAIDGLARLADAPAAAKKQNTQKKLFGPSFQRRLLANVLNHPLAMQFPPRTSFQQALLKRVTGLIELEHIQTRRQQEDNRCPEQDESSSPEDSNNDDKNNNTDDDDDDDDDDEFDELFLEAVIRVKVQAADDVEQMSASPTREATSFKTFLIPQWWRDGKNSSNSKKACEEENAATTVCGCQKGFHDVSPVALRVGDQFLNVGLSLWPSAYVSVLVLARLLLMMERTAAAAACTHDSTKVDDNGNEVQLLSSLPLGLPLGGNLRRAPPSILELGAGVGMTSICLDKLLPQTAAARFIATDYQPVIVENCSKNIQLNQSRHNSPLTSPPTDEIASSSPSLLSRCEAALLDWTEHEANAAKLRQWGPDLIVAADCIYDVEVIPALAETLRQALYNNNTSSHNDHDDDGISSSVATAPVALVVQTHRNADTIALFLEHVASFAVCESFRFVAEDPDDANTSSFTSNARCSCCSSWRLAQWFCDPADARSRGLEGSSAEPVNGFVGPFFVEMVDRVGLHLLRRKQQSR